MKTILLGALMFGAFPLHGIAAVELAKVNGKSITDRDMTMALGGFNEGQRASFLKDKNSRKQILSRLIDQELLVGQAEKEKLDQEKDFKDAIEAFKKQLLASRLVQRSISANVNESASKKYYESNKTKFSTDEVHVQHILLADEAKAKAVLAQAISMDQEKFMKLAASISIDPSAANNRGDIGLITHDSPFVPEFKNAAFAAKQGEVVGPVKTDYGYHIIRVEKKKIGRPLNYEEVELKVKDALRNDLIRDYLAGLRRQAKISVDDKALDKL